jgi:hypothetical protein
MQRQASLPPGTGAKTFNAQHSTFNSEGRAIRAFLGYSALKLNVSGYPKIKFPAFH